MATEKLMVLQYLMSLSQKYVPHTVSGIFFFWDGEGEKASSNTEAVYSFSLEPSNRV